MAGETETVCRRRSLKDQRNAARAVLEIIDGLGIGPCRIGVIEALNDRPWGMGAPHCAGPDRLSVKRIDPSSIARLAGKARASALERCFDALEPILARCGRKVGDKRMIHHQANLLHCTRGYTA